MMNRIDGGGNEEGRQGHRYMYRYVDRCLLIYMYIYQQQNAMNGREETKLIVLGCILYCAVISTG